MKKIMKISVTGVLTLLVASLFLVTQLPKTTVYAGELSKVAITFKEPAAGDSAAIIPEIKSNGDYEIDSFGYYEISNTEQNFTGTFEAGHTYLASMNVMFAKGDSLTDDVTITINGTKLYSLLDDNNEGLNVYIDVSYDDYAGAMLTYTFTIPKSGSSSVAKAPTLKVKATKSTLKYSKKQQTVKLTVATNSKGKVSYSTASTSKKLQKYVSVNSKGVVTFKKKAPKGNYKIKVAVAAKGKYKSASKTITIKIK